MKKENKESVNITKFTKEQIINSKRFAAYKKDVMVAALKNDMYSIEEAEKEIKAFMGKVVR